MATATKQTKGSMSPRPRKELSKAEKRTPWGRFALHLRALMDERGWDHQELASRMNGAATEAAVRKWLRAEGMPDYERLVALGEALDTREHPFPDYRMALPPAR